jgi:hypothetical protein
VNGLGGGRWEKAYTSSGLCLGPLAATAAYDIFACVSMLKVNSAVCLSSGKTYERVAGCC